MHWKAQIPPDIHVWFRVLLKWAVAESEVLAGGCTRGAGIGGLQMWDSYVLNMEAKDDMRPP